MGGTLGFGQSDTEKQSRGNLNNIFNYALPAATSSGSSGSADLGTASDYFTKLLRSGRTDTALAAAPATNAVLDSGDALRRQESTSGTGRTGGTAELNHEAGAKTTATIDDIINANMMGGKEKAATGLVGVGSEEDANAARLLGIGSGAEVPLYSGAVSKEGKQASDLLGLAGLGSNSVGGAGITSFVKYLFG